jgi:hypothetical protein
VIVAEAALCARRGTEMRLEISPKIQRRAKRFIGEISFVVPL